MSAFAAVCPPGQDVGLLARVVARSLMPRATPDRSATPTDALARYAQGASPEAVAAAERAATVWARLGVTVHHVGGPGYPPRLARRWPAAGVPAWLAVRGPAWPSERPAVAIVGARRASGYGTGVAAWLAEAAARAGAVVVSGGAVGVDAAAHGGALAAATEDADAGGTAVVLGCGHDVPYPRPHAAPGALFDRVLDAGGWLLSGFPPDAPPRPARVRARNRVVAGLVDAVVVVEGRRRSGSLATASDAADLDVTVLAVPGDVRAPGSEAPNLLLAEGAAPCRGPADLLAVLGRPPGGDDGTSGADGAGVGDGGSLSAEVAALLRARWPRPVAVAALADAVDRPVGALLAELTRARVRGEVAEGPDGVRLRRSPGR